MDKYIGKRLDGRYEIHELIGFGGMANVYRCTDTLDDREVAIKILKDEYLNNEEFIRRFKNESKAIATLSHPNIVKVYDVSFGDMIQYIVMEYIDGITLKEYFDQQGILVTVFFYRNNIQEIPAFFTFCPQTVLGTAEEGYFTGFHCLSVCFFIHKP